MLNLRKRFSLRISDHLAIAVAVVLSVTAAGGVVADRFMPAAPAENTVMPAETDAADPTSDETVGGGGLTVGLFLFKNS